MKKNIKITLLYCAIILLNSCNRSTEITSNENIIVSVNTLNMDVKKNIYHNTRIKVDTIIVERQREKEINFSACRAKYPSVTGFNDSSFQDTVNTKIKKLFNNVVLKTKKESKEISDDYKKSGGYESYATYGSIDFFDFNIDYFSKNLLIIRVRYTIILGGGNAWDPHSKIFFIDLKNEKLIEPCSNIFDFSILGTTEINLAIKQYIKNKYKDSKVEDLNITNLTDSALSVSEYSIVNDTLVIYTEQYPLAHNSHYIYKVPIIDLNIKGLKEEYKYLINK